MKPTWVVTPQAPAEFFHEMLDIPQLTAQLLWNRGVKTREAAERFLHPDATRDLHDPFLFGDMQKAAERIGRAFRDGERIGIWGDYDCDGVCGTTILYTLFRDMGHEAKVNVHIPDRNKEGYGLTMTHLEELHREGIQLLITVDCGITDVAEITWAREQGIDVIIADHHSVPEKLPPAYAILNPKDPRSGYPFYGLAGTGVAFKLACAVLKTSNFQLPTSNFLDLAAIATLADSMPLRDENRAIIKEGLAQLLKTTRPGLKALLEFCGLASGFSVRDLHFTVIPLINAMGRMEHASISFRLLSTQNPDEATSLIRHLDERNRERQLVVDVIVREVLERVSAYPAKPALVFESASHWMPGVLGLAAQRVMNEVGRPVVLALTREETREVMGNARAVGTFNIVEVLHAHPELFTDAGGHPHAGGFSTTPDKMDAVRDVFLRAGEKVEREGGYSEGDAVAIDAQMQWQDLTWASYTAAQQLWPFGEENTEPQFLLRALPVGYARTVGNNKNHLKLRLTRPDTANDGGPASIEAIAFGLGARATELPAGSTVDVVAKLSENTWNGNRSLELQIIDFDRI